MLPTDAAVALGWLLRVSSLIREPGLAARTEPDTIAVNSMDNLTNLRFIATLL
jgi:hypothetical protein